MCHVSSTRFLNITVTVAVAHTYTRCGCLLLCYVRGLITVHRLDYECTVYCPFSNGVCILIHVAQFNCAVFSLVTMCLHSVDCLLLQVGSLQEEIKSLKDEIQKQKQELKKRDGIIASLRTDIEGLKKEIQERDDTIQDKVSYVSIILTVY